MDWINDVLRDVAELPDRNSPAEWPEAMLVTAQELHQILEAHWPAPSMPVNARLLEALRANHQWHIDHDEDDGYPGSDLEATNLGAIAAAEAKQVEPVRLTTFASRDMLAERRRQVEAEGWTSEHDDEHDAGEMARAPSPVRR